jgi:uncharacterized protein (DUF1800 family)
MRAISRTTSLAALALIIVAAPTGLAEPSKTGVPVKPDDRTIAHVLNRLGFGPRAGDVDTVRRMGLQAYIDRQLTPERIDDAALAERLATFTTLSKSARDLADEYYLPAQMARRQRQKEQSTQQEGADPGPPQPRMPAQTATMQKERQALGEVMQAKILRAAYSERQLEEVMVDFWFNHFNVFAGKGPIRIYLNEYERDAIRPHVLGKFRDLLAATAESPAMLFYLDNWQSAAPEGAPTAAANIRRLNPEPIRPEMFRPNRVRPGTAPRPPAQMPVNPPSVTQNRRRGVNENYAREIMELHTLGVDGGYTQKDVQEVARAFTGWTIANPRQGGAFRFEPRMHDDGDKVVLGHRIRSGGGKKDGEEVLALLAKHPSTARFISTKVARRFVADDPPAALVDRAAERFRETDGNIREVVRAIVTSPEFFAAASYRAKVKTPFEFVVSAIRATNTELVNAQFLVGAVRNLGMPLYGCQPPTGYADKAEAWVNSGALLNRMNFAVSLTSSTTRGAGGRPPQDRAMARPSITSETLVASVLAGDLSESTEATIANATTHAQALALVLGSPEFQKR